eukprot:gnl/TRDRNA2_/TRDRNA2_211207_c0_seq1.p2 gnl/TRDRNA2_/TRDRNA2_211207_c0~~gnl/TRDRNA2_/TRDRNA2_211207_c0_seq1.p2  ORF type:complete len:109 (-),score=15.07 gnl/TRDRNA2_/TRDRNA2_211207_c0_seq1:92-370(-)
MISQLNSWAAALRPRLRIFFADPLLNEVFMRTFCLTIDDAPTAVADDTMGSLGTFFLRDHGSGTGCDLDMEHLRQWLGVVAKASGASNIQLQ